MSTLIMSPSRTSPSGPPAAPSGLTSAGEVRHGDAVVLTGLGLRSLGRAHSAGWAASAGSTTWSSVYGVELSASDMMPSITGSGTRQSAQRLRAGLDLHHHLVLRRSPTSAAV